MSGKRRFEGAGADIRSSSQHKMSAKSITVEMVQHQKCYQDLVGREIGGVAKFPCRGLALFTFLRQVSAGVSVGKSFPFAWKVLDGKDCGHGAHRDFPCPL